ncbi:MAG TPA: peptidylprolyl isomerase [Planctomycetota bacterium]
MAKHKAATQVTVASIQEPSLFQQFVERYWKLGVIVAVVATVAILYPTYANRKSQETAAESWNELRTQANLASGFLGGIQGGSPDALALFADQHRAAPVGAWAKALEVGSHLQEEEFEEAQKAAGQLGQLWPEHLLSTTPLVPGEDGSAITIEAAIQKNAGLLQAWEKEHAMLFSNPELPADAPRVRIVTSKGTIVVGLYVDRAPRHAENFLRLCREGLYTGTKFHRVVRGSLIQGGDPNSVSGEPETWGTGGEAAVLEPELDPRLRHFKGALVAWKGPGETRSHGSQFFLTTADQNQMDGQTVVFGRVLEGQQAIETIESGAVVGDRPQDPAVIESVEIL